MKMTPTNDEKLEQVTGGRKAENVVSEGQQDGFIIIPGGDNNDTDQRPAVDTCVFCRSKNIAFVRFEFCKPLNQTVRVYRCKDCGREF